MYRNNVISNLKYLLELLLTAQIGGRLPRKGMRDIKSETTRLLVVASTLLFLECKDAATKSVPALLMLQL